MKLEEAFKKYSDETKMKRPDSPLIVDIKYLKQAWAWHNPKDVDHLREIGFILPKFMVDHYAADDWEIIK
jgi:hypothetical protein